MENRLVSAARAIGRAVKEGVVNIVSRIIDGFMERLILAIVEPAVDVVQERSLNVVFGCSLNSKWQAVRLISMVRVFRGSSGVGGYCRVGNYVPMSWRCDNIQDRDNGQDEKEYWYVRNCTVDLVVVFAVVMSGQRSGKFFKCLNREKVLGLFLTLRRLKLLFLFSKRFNNSSPLGTAPSTSMLVC